MIDPALVRFLNELFLYHACYGYDLRLLSPGNSFHVENLTDAPDCLIPVDDRHLTLHNYQREAIGLSFFEALVDLFKGLVAILHVDTVVISVFEAQNHQKAINDVVIRDLVIDDEDFTLGLQFFGLEVREQKLYFLVIFLDLNVFSFVTLLLGYGTF